jgi:hypothetical protein
MMKERAQELGRNKFGDNQAPQPSRNWFRSFVKRRPELVVATAKALEANRHDNATVHQISHWFQTVLQPLFTEHEYDPRLIANCDETMVQMTAQSKAVVVVPRLNGYKRFKEVLGGTHITFVVTAFANGDKAPTLIIYPCKTLPKKVTLESIIADPEFIITGRNGGWIDKEIFDLYCRNQVIPRFEEQRRTHSVKGRGLFLLDGHSSRWNWELMEEFSRHEIDVVTLISHTSHVCQPLDALVFKFFRAGIRSHLRTALNHAIQDTNSVCLYEDAVEDTDEESKEGTDEELATTVEVESSGNDAQAQNKRRTFSNLTSAQRRYCLIECAKMALHTALYREHIRKSFKTTGIYPLNLQQALKREGVREVPDMDIYRENLSTSNKRKKRIDQWNTFEPSRLYR